MDVIEDSERDQLVRGLVGAHRGHYGSEPCGLGEMTHVLLRRMLAAIERRKTPGDPRVTRLHVVACYVISAKFMCSGAVPLARVFALFRGVCTGFRKRTVRLAEMVILDEIGWSLRSAYEEVREAIEAQQLPAVGIRVPGIDLSGML